MGDGPGGRDAIADALLHRKAKPIPPRPPEQGRRERVLVTLRRDGATGVRAELRIGAQLHGEAAFATLPNGLAETQAAFLQGFRYGMRRDAATEYVLAVRSTPL
jgi:hypothetical protein